MNFLTETADYLFSTKRAKSWLYFFITTIAVYVLLILAIITYIITYYLYIPYPAIPSSLHMDYSYTGGGSFAAVDVSSVSLSNVPYKISVLLDLPRDEYNQKLGNFMVRMTVVNSTLDEFLMENPFPEYSRQEGTKVVNPATPVVPNEPTISSNQWRLRDEIKFSHPLPSNHPYAPSLPYHPSQKWPLTHNKKYTFDRLPGFVSSTKPAILPYKSSLLEMIETLFFSPLYVVGFWQQKNVIQIPMMDWSISASKTSKSVVVEIDRTVNINSASLLWSVQWRGLRYYMYYHWILMFIIGTGFFWFIETVMMLLVAWYIFHGYKSHEEDEEIYDRDLIDSKVPESESLYELEDELEDPPYDDNIDFGEVDDSVDIGINDSQEVNESNPTTGQQTPTASVVTATDEKIDHLLRNRAIKLKPEPTIEPGSSSSISRPQLDLLDSLGPDPGPPTPAATPGPWEDDSYEDVNVDVEVINTDADIHQSPGLLNSSEFTTTPHDSDNDIS